MNDDEPTWVERGACFKLRDTVGGVREALRVFYPDPGGLTLRFRLVCDVCQVRCECLLWGILAEDYGGWGGTDEHERRAMRADLRDGTFSLADLLRQRECSAIADQVEDEDAEAVAEASQRRMRPS